MIAHPAPAHWEVVADSAPLSRALFHLAARSQEIVNVERIDTGGMKVIRVNGAGVLRTVWYGPGGGVLDREDGAW